MQQPIDYGGYYLSAIFHTYPPFPIGVFGFMFSGFFILTFPTHFVHSYAASQRNGGLSCRGKIQDTTAVLFTRI
jgi:hypothetical protein